MPDSVDTPPRPTARLTGAARREGILRAATDVFCTVGYHGATIAAIAAAAGCSEPTLYKHVRDKRDLLLACLRLTEDQVEREIEEIIDAPNQLEAWTRYANSSRDYRNMLMMRMLCSTFTGDEEMVQLLRGATDRMLARFRIGVERGTADGTMAPADPEYVAWLWLGLSLAGFEALAISGEERFRSASETRTRLLLDALAPR